MRLFAAILAVAVLWQTFTADAHSWYPDSCCSDKDCIPIPVEAIKVTPEGYVIVKTGELLKWKDPRVRVTPEEHGLTYHWCRRLEDVPATVYSRAFKKDETICLFVPGSGM